MNNVFLIIMGSWLSVTVHNITFSNCKKWILTSKQWHSCYLETCHVTSDVTR